MRFLRNSSPSRFSANLRRNLHLAQYSLDVLRELRKNTSLSFDQTNSGTLMIFRTRASFEASVQRCAELRPLGLSSEPVSVRSRLLDLEPALQAIGSQLVGGIYYPDDCSGDARQFAVSLADQAKRLGVRFVFDTDVTAVAKMRDRITSVTTAAGAL